jgi:predicted nucleic acid-binding protein
MNVVVDASAVLKWLIFEDDSEAALQVRTSHDVIAPDLLLIECRNVLLTKVRRGELHHSEAEEKQRAFEEIESAMAIVSSSPLLRQAFTIALDLAEPIYDCIYLAAALAVDQTLITADGRFAAKAARSRFGKNRVTLLRSMSS